MKRVTLAMKMMSATKLHRAQEAQRRARQFFGELTQIASHIAAGESIEHPLLTPRKTVSHVLMLVITSDMGLCGGFNNTLNKKVARWIRERKSEAKLRLSFCGKRGYLFFRPRVEVRSHYEGATHKPDFAKSLQIGKDIMGSFLEQKYDEVYMAYNLYNNPVSQTPTIVKLLPFEPPKAARQSTGIRNNYLFEPTRIELLDEMLKKLFFYQIYYALLENAAGEHGARMTAMDNASRNIDTLSDKYLLLRNRARQASITRELIEIVSGAEAIK